MSGYDTTSDAESGMVGPLWWPATFSQHSWSIFSAGEARVEQARGFTALSWGIHERLWHTGFFFRHFFILLYWHSEFLISGFSYERYFSTETRTLLSPLERRRVFRRRASNNFKSTERRSGAICIPWILLRCACRAVLHVKVSSIELMVFWSSEPIFPSNVMVKYVPEVSSWQLLFVRCSMQVRIKSGDLRKVEVPLAIPQLVTMLPLVYLSGQNIMGTPDLATRYIFWITIFWYTLESSEF